MEPSSMFGILSSLLVLGIGFILLFILLSLVIGAISLYLSGKIVKSINDEFLSAIKAIAYGFLLGIGITIVMWLFAFLGTKIASLQSVFEILNSLMIILYIVVFFIIVKKIYDLNIIKTFLMLVVAFVINGVIGAIIAIIFGGFFFGTIAEKIASQVATEPVAVVEEEKIEDEAITEEEIAEEEAEPGKRPGIPKKEPEEVVEEEDIELAAKTCTFSYECNQTDEFCLEGVCKSKDQLTAKFGLSLCDQPCENCVSGKIEKTFINYDPDEWGGSMRIRPKTQMIEGFTDDDEYEAEICTECIDDFSCKEGYGCKNFKCVEGYLSEGSKKNANTLGSACTKSKDCNEFDEMCYRSTCTKIKEVEANHAPPCEAPCENCKSGVEKQLTFSGSTLTRSFVVPYCGDCLFSSDCNEGLTCSSGHCVPE